VIDIIEKSLHILNKLILLPSMKKEEKVYSNYILEEDKELEDPDKYDDNFIV